MTKKPGEEADGEGVRLQKWLAEAGLCSRREGERWIAAGRVSIDGKVVHELGVRVMPGHAVAVDGTPVSGERGETMVLALHKPRGTLCTTRDMRGRPIVFDLLDPGLPRLIYVGRLDYNSEGLLLFTNDGELANRLTHPSQAIQRIYRARVHGRVDDGMLAALRQGVTLEDGPTGPLTVSRDRDPTGGNTWLTLTLSEGRNREVRRIFEHFDMTVSRLIRTAFADIDLGELESGKWRLLRWSEINKLRRTAGLPAAERKRGGSQVHIRRDVPGRPSAGSSPRDGERGGPRDDRRTSGERRPSGSSHRDGERSDPRDDRRMSGERRPSGSAPRDGERGGPRDDRKTSGERRPAGSSPRDGERGGPRDSRGTSGERRSAGSSPRDGERGGPRDSRGTSGERRPAGSSSRDGERGGSRDGRGASGERRPAGSAPRDVERGGVRRGGGEAGGGESSSRRSVEARPARQGGEGRLAGSGKREPSSGQSRRPAKKTVSPKGA